MTNVIKYSQFPPGTLTQAVGLNGAVNTRGPSGGGAGASITYTFTQATAVTPALYLGAAARVDVATGLWETTLATTPLGAEFYGFIVGIAGDAYTVQFGGEVPAGTPLITGLIPGTPYYLSDTVAGGISAVPPTVMNEVNLPVLWAMDNGNSVIKMSRGYVVGGGLGGGAGGSGGTANNVLTVTQSGNTFALGDVLYLESDNTFSKSNSYSTLAAAQAEWMVISITVPNTTFVIQQGGKVQALVVTDDVGAPIASGPIYYVSPIVGMEGKLTQVNPTGPGQYSKPFYLQQTLSSNTGWLLDQRPTLNSTGGRAFIGQLNAANSFDSTLGPAPFVLGGFSIYYLEMNIGQGGGGRGPGIEGVGGVPLTIGFELLINGVYYSGTNYAHLCSGINTTANSPGMGVLWGNVQPGSGDNSLVVFPAIGGTDVVLGGLVATMNISPNNTTVLMQYDAIISDLTHFPPTSVVYTSNGWAQMGQPGICTGLKLVFGTAGMIQAGSQAFINVYGEIGS